MGSTGLIDMIAVANRGLALKWHLESNLYPPRASRRDLATASKAIQLGQEGLFDEPVEILLTDAFDFTEFESVMGRPMTEAEKTSTTCLTCNGQKVTAGMVIEDWHLEEFLDPPED